MRDASSSPTFPLLLQDFFCQRLKAHRNASARTIATYRDAFRLLLQFAHGSIGRAPSALTLADLDAPMILRFLDHLEKSRSNSVRTRNARLAAIRSFLRYASLRDPASLPAIQRVLAIPMKRFDSPLIGFLDRKEIDAILAAPDRSTWTGRRDRAMLATFYNTGARVSEVVAMQASDVSLAPQAAVTIHGKGRKDRAVPLWKSTAAVLKSWLHDLSNETAVPLFPSRDRRPFSRTGIQDRLDRATATAQRTCPSLTNRHITPHVLRHTTAMHLLQAGVDITVIALWLGHASPATTHHYIEADLEMKRRALGHLESPDMTAHRFRPSDRLLAFLDGLTLSTVPGDLSPPCMPTSPTHPRIIASRA